MNKDDLKQKSASEAWRVIRRKPSFSLLTVAVFVVGFVLRGCLPF